MINIDIDVGKLNIDPVINKLGIDAFKNSILFVYDNARLLAPANSGNLRDNIFWDIEANGNEVVGYVFTDVEYAQFVEFGTGQKGQAHHEGVNPDIPITYRMTPWWIHESMVDPQYVSMYHWFYIDTEDGRFYRINGMPAQPYMYPALKNYEDQVKKIIGEDLDKIL